MSYNDILRYFPDNIRVVLENEINNNLVIEEIRIRNSKPIILKLNNSEKIINYIVQTEDVLKILQSICENSIYSYQNQICEGFITIKGGHRIGITGSAVIENNKVKNINYISNLNFRIARQIIGCSNNIIKEIINQEENTIYNTLIVSSPGAGKTTLLRDIIRNLSNGTVEITGKNIGVVDERGEIAAMYKGIPQNDLGIRTDIIENIKKSVGMKMLIRSMAPEIIVADEIGSKEDVQEINYAVCSGIKGIFTAHGNSLEDLKLNPAIAELIEKNIFEKLVFLDKKHKGKVNKIYALDKINKEYKII
jgi:stage III sporulation protein AA